MGEVMEHRDCMRPNAEQETDEQYAERMGWVRDELADAWLKAGRREVVRSLQYDDWDIIGAEKHASTLRGAIDWCEQNPVDPPKPAVNFDCTPIELDPEPPMVQGRVDEPETDEDYAEQMGFAPDRGWYEQEYTWTKMLDGALYELEVSPTGWWRMYRDKDWVVTHASLRVTVDLAIAHARELSTLDDSVAGEPEPPMGQWRVDIGGDFDGTTVTTIKTPEEWRELFGGEPPQALDDGPIPVRFDWPAVDQNAGKKGKVHMEYVPLAFVAGVAEVMEAGLEEPGRYPGSWLELSAGEHGLYVGAALRHLRAIQERGLGALDEKSGKLHAYHLGACAVIMAGLAEKHGLEDGGEL